MHAAKQTIRRFTSLKTSFPRTLISLWGILLRSITSSFRANIFSPLVQTTNYFFTQLYVVTYFSNNISSRGGNKNILNKKKKRDYFLLFSLTKICSKNAITLSVLNNNFIFLNKRKNEDRDFIENYSAVPFYISQTKTCNNKKKKTSQGEKRGGKKHCKSPKINVEKEKSLE